MSTFPPTYQSPAPQQWPAQPQQPQPGPGMPSPWPQYPAPPAPPARSRRGLVLVVLVLAVLGIGGGAYLATQGDDGGASPEQAVLDYRQAVESRDCDTVIGFWTDDFIDTTLGMTREEALAECEPSTFDVEDITIDSSEVVSQDGDAAVVELTWTGEESGAMVSRFDLVRQDGRWLIDSLAESSA